MNHLAIALLCGLSMLCLALAMDKYQSDWWGSELSPRFNVISRSLGWLFMVLSLVPVFTAPAVSLALVAWFGYLNAAAASVLLGLVIVTRWRARQHSKARSRTA